MTDNNSIRRITTLCGITIAQLRIHVSKQGAPDVIETAQNSEAFITWYIRYVQDNTTLGKLSTMFGVDERTINNLAKSGKLPRTERGVYPLTQCVRARIDELQKQIDYLRQAGDTEEQINKEKLLFLKIKNAKLQGQLLNIKDSPRVFAEIFNDWRRKFQLLRRRVAPQLLEMFDDFTGEALLELSRAPEKFDSLQKFEQNSHAEDSPGQKEKPKKKKLNIKIKSL